MPLKKVLSYGLWFLISISLFLLLWKSLILLNDYPSFILPEPESVFKKIYSLFNTGKIYSHFLTTLTEVFFGFLLGFSLGVILGYLVSKKRKISHLFTPYIVAFQSIPIIALAPLLIIWFGTGMTPKIIVSSLIVFFPIFAAVILSMNSVKTEYRDFMFIINASSFQILTKLEIPFSLPYIFSGVKTSIIYAVVGAVVGEFLGASRGLGFLISQAIGLFDTSLLFAVLILLSLLGLILYLFVIILEKKIVFWKGI